MCFDRSVEDLPSFGIPDITRYLRRKRQTLHKIDSSLSAFPRGYVEIVWNWTTYSGGYLNRTENKHSVKCYVRRDTSGLYLEIRYTQVGERDGERKEIPFSVRYDFARRESNLKPGTYRYYFKDPYSPDGEGLCTRLYLLPELGEFVPRSVLISWRVRYSNQRRGKKDRYLHPRKVPDTRYRKSHYRGRETPFWRSYRERSEEEDYRQVQNFLTLCPGLFDRETERTLLEDFYRQTGRKSGRLRPTNSHATNATDTQKTGER